MERLSLHDASLDASRDRFHDSNHKVTSMVKTPLPWGMVSETSWERRFARNGVESDPTRDLAIGHDASITHLAQDL